MLKYLVDENVNPAYPRQLRRKKPDLTIRVIGETATPSRGTLDPEILVWCETYDFALVTNNRASMPVHLAEHIQQGHHIPGIFILNPSLSLGQNIDELILIAEVAFEDEFNDQIVFLPVA
jgi:hypothetical protein